MKTWRRAWVLAALGAAAAAGPSLALDEGRVRDIARADSMEELAELAGEIAEDMAEKPAADAPERTAVAAETAAYLLYIQVRQERLLYRSLGDKLERLVNKDLGPR